MASVAQAKITAGSNAIRTVPRDAMVARSAVNSLSLGLMDASPAVQWHPFWSITRVERHGNVKPGADKIVIDRAVSLAPYSLSGYYPIHITACLTKSCL